MMVVAFSAGKRFSPHVNLGYQWNGNSILAGNLTGATVGETNDVATIQTGPATSARLPSQFFYSLGADYGVTKRLTLNVGLRFDYLNNYVPAEHNGPGPFVPNRNVDRPTAD